VDGNVIRVFSRLKMIGADCTAQATMDFFWYESRTHIIAFINAATVKTLPWVS
jgi:adenine-specific DNA glycosylase